MIHLVLLLALFKGSLASSIAESNADLTVKILGKVGENGNLFFSPASLMYGVAMLYEGMDDRWSLLWCHYHNQEWLLSGQLNG